MLKTLDDITNRPFLLIYCVISWPFYVLIGIKNLWKQGCSDSGNALATHVAEGFINDHKPRRSSITGVPSKGSHFSTTVVTTDSDGSVDDGSHESGKEDFSDAFDSQVWGTEKHEYSCLGKANQMPIPDDVSFIRQNNLSSLQSHKRTRSSSVLDHVHGDVPPTEDIHRAVNTKIEMSKGCQLSSQYCHGCTKVEMDLSQEPKDCYAIETESMESVRNGRSVEIPENFTTSLERPNIFRPEISLWPMGSVDSIPSHTLVGGGTLVCDKKRSLLCKSRIKISTIFFLDHTQTSTKSHVHESFIFLHMPCGIQTSIKLYFTNLTFDEFMWSCEISHAVLESSPSNLPIIFQVGNSYSKAVTTRLKAMISRKVPGEQNSRPNDCDQKTVSFTK